MPLKALKSESFSDLNSRGWSRGGTDPDTGDPGFDDEERVRLGDDDLDEPVAHVDVNELDLDKAITAGLGPEVNDDPDAEGDESEETKQRAKPSQTEQRSKRDDDEQYSKRTRKRIERERRVTATERQRRIEVERERDELRDRLAAVEKKQGAQDVAAIDGEIQAHARELDDLEKRLAQASTDAEHEDVAKITRQMQEASAKRIAAEQRKAAASAGTRKPGGENGHDPDRKATASKIDPRAKDLMDVNADWWDDEDHIEDRQVILAIDKAVAADGYTPNTDEYYVEMVRRARRRGLGDLIQLPEWMSEDDVVDKDAQRNGRRDATRNKRNARKPAARGPGGVGEGGREIGEERRLRAEAAGKVSLTREDLRRMEHFRLDPTNKAHQRQWALSKQEAARAALAQQRE